MDLWPHGADFYESMRKMENILTRACSIKITFGIFTTMRRFSGITVLSGARIRGAAAA